MRLVLAIAASLMPLLAPAAQSAERAGARLPSRRGEGVPPAATALRNATVVDIDAGKTLAGQTIVVQGGKITALGPTLSTPVPKGARVVELAGRFVIPGLIDAHSHVFGFARGDSAAVDFDGAWEYASGMMLAHGVTSARMPGGDIRVLSALRERVRRGETMGPRLWIAGWKLGQRAALPGAPFPVRTPDDATRTVRLLAEAGGDFMKFEYDLSPDVWFAAAREARGRSMAIESHMPLRVPLTVAADSGLRNVAHLFGLDLETTPEGEWLASLEKPRSLARLYERVKVKLGLMAYPKPIVERAIDTHSTQRSQALFAHLASRGTSVTPTLALHATIEKDASLFADAERLRYLDDFLDIHQISNGTIKPQSERAKRIFAFELQLVREMKAAGVTILAGSDAPTNNPPGLALHHELALLVRAGLTPREALGAATTSVAKYMRADSLAVIRPGAVADLVVLRANPLEHIAATRTIDYVVTAGRLLDRATLDEMLAHAERAVTRHREADRLMRARANP